jgi:hypothetical protein
MELGTLWIRKRNFLRIHFRHSRHFAFPGRLEKWREIWWPSWFFQMKLKAFTYLTSCRNGNETLRHSCWCCVYHICSLSQPFPFMHSGSLKS